MFDALLQLRSLRDLLDTLPAHGYKPPRKVTDQLALADAFAGAQPPNTEAASFANTDPSDAQQAVVKYTLNAVLADPAQWTARANDLASVAASRALAAFRPEHGKALAALDEPYRNTMGRLADTLPTIPTHLRDSAEKMLNAGTDVQQAYLDARDLVATLDSIEQLRKNLEQLGVRITHSAADLVPATTFVHFDGYPQADAHRRALSDSPQWLHGWDAVHRVDARPWLPQPDEHTAHVTELATDRERYHRDERGQLVRTPPPAQGRGGITAAMPSAG